MPSTSSTSPAWADAEAIEDAKVALRTAVRTSRSARSEKKRADAAKSIAVHLLALPELKNARCVSIYASQPTEPGTLPAIEALAARGIRVLLPVLGDGLQRCWGEYQGADDLVERAPGRPPEPSGELLPQAAIADADVVVAPALAVDRAGTRLGQGGGWYDRVLKEARPDALLVAATFTDEVRLGGTPLPRETHDVPVHAVVTPSGVTRFTR
jgi:5-formyltetrahydrofolate cyclo-ligase